MTQLCCVLSWRWHSGCPRALHNSMRTGRASWAAVQRHSDPLSYAFTGLSWWANCPSAATLMRLSLLERVLDSLHKLKVAKQQGLMASRQSRSPKSVPLSI